VLAFSPPDLSVTCQYKGSGASSLVMVSDPPPPEMCSAGMAQKDATALGEARWAPLLRRHPRHDQDCSFGYPRQLGLAQRGSESDPAKAGGLALVNPNSPVRLLARGVLLSLLCLMIGGLLLLVSTVRPTSCSASAHCCWL
jgi:hypothetical protein